MTEASQGQRSPDSEGSPGPSPAEAAHRGEASYGGTASSSVPASTQGDYGPSRAVLGPFTLRELVFGGGVALVFIGTLLPFLGGRVLYTNFWNTAPLFFVGIGILLPVIATALLAGRRLGSAGLRVGSLSVDQFASVSAVLAATFFFLQTVTAFQIGPLVALVGALVMLAATVAGPFLPGIKNDFVDRPEVPAHGAARPITAARPRPAKPAREETEGDDVLTGGSDDREAQSARPGVNPAAAVVRQNGAGLYGAGGAGVVGAGPAASGQSGLEREATKRTAGEGTRDAADEQASDGPQAGAHAVGVGTDGGGSAGSSPSGAGTPEVASSQSEPASSAATVTRVHDVAREDSTRDHAAGTAGDGRSRQEPITATRSTDEEPVVEAFWFAVGSPRPVFDEQTGREVFTLQPGDWEVGIEDRGREFLVQDKRTGAVGILRDLRNIERAPRD